MKLTIISHTEHYRNSHGEIVGWGPTIREINHLTKVFEKIYHIAYVYEDEIAPPSTLPYTSDKIEFVPLKPVGGKSLKDKLSIIRAIPGTIATVKKYLALSDIFQFRAPTGMGVYLIPWLTFFTRKKGWFKYAGNWNQENPPLGYALQRFWLVHFNTRTVTINGKWPGQKSNFIAFENPCLTDGERQTGEVFVAKKSYKMPFIGCFVGRVETAKGMGRILDYFRKEEHTFSTFHVIGDGPEKPEFEALAKEITGMEIFFHGSLPKTSVNTILEESHFLFLPSTASEGFPKVIAEAANFGCIPIVSDVSSIGQYINTSNGFLWPLKGQLTFGEWMEKLVFMEKDLQQKAEVGYYMSGDFSYERNNARIISEIALLR